MSALSKGPFGNSRAQSNLALAPALFLGGVVTLFLPIASLRTSGRIRRAESAGDLGGVIVCPSLALRCHSLNVWVESIKPTPILDILDFDDCDLRTDTVSALVSLTGIRGALAPGLTVSFDILPDRVNSFTLLNVPVDHLTNSLLS